MARHIVLAVFIGACVSSTSGLFFFITSPQEKCFLDDFPSNTVVVGKFGLERRDGTRVPGVGLRIVAKGPTNHDLLDIKDEVSGTFAFHSEEGGTHKICLSTNTSDWNNEGELKVTFSVEHGEGSTDYKDLAKQEHLTEMDIKMRKLNDMVKDIRSEQDFQRNREFAFRDTSESTNARVAWFSVLQVVVLLVSTFLQLTHLKKFFKEKKYL